jgi:ferrous iron transport protein A
MTLADLKPGQSAEVTAVAGDPALIQRLCELGLFEGESVEFLTTAPLGDPVEVRLGNTRLSLRKAEATSVAVRLL